LLPSAEKILRQLGENSRLARKRRGLSLQQVAERADMARSILGLIEKGSPGAAMSAYLQVLFVLGRENDLQQVAADDPLGRKLQDAGLLSGGKNKWWQNRQDITSSFGYMPTGWNQAMLHSWEC
jgi:transcriptional regulator with XRE-family HTH domain